MAGVCQKIAKWDRMKLRSKQTSPHFLSCKTFFSSLSKSSSMGGNPYLIIDVSGDKTTFVCFRLSTMDHSHPLSDPFILSFLWTLVQTSSLIKPYVLVLCSVSAFQKEEIIRVMNLMRVRRDVRLDGLKDLYRVHLDSLITILLFFMIYIPLIMIMIFEFLGVIHCEETDVLELMIGNGLMETLSIIFAEETDPKILVCIFRYILYLLLCLYFNVDGIW